MRSFFFFRSSRCTRCASSSRPSGIFTSFARLFFSTTASSTVFSAFTFSTGFSTTFTLAGFSTLAKSLSTHFVPESRDSPCTVATRLRLVPSLTTVTPSEPFSP